MGLWYILVEVIFYSKGIKERFELINLVLIKRDSTGAYSSKAKRSYVFMFNINDDDNSVRNMLGVWVLIHELRHHYQHTKKNKFLHFAEKDSERFTYRMIMKNYSEYKTIVSDN